MDAMLRTPFRAFALVAAGAAAALALLTGFAPRASDATLADGRRTFEAYCVACHGYDGAGGGPDGGWLRWKPRDLTHAQYRFRSTASGQLPLDADLERTILGGLPNTGMPPFPTLAPRTLVDLVAYVKSLAPRFAEPAEYPLDTLRPGPPVAYSAESIRRGRDVYLRAKCWECHGAQGQGDGPSAHLQRDDQGNPIFTNNLSFPWTNKQGRTPADIYRIYSTGMNGTTMPSYAEGFTNEERWDLANYTYALGRPERLYDTLSNEDLSPREEE